MPARQLREEVRAGDVDGEVLAEHVDVLGLCRRRQTDPGVVHEDVESSVGLERRVDEPAAVVVDGHVRRDHGRPRQLGGEGLEAVGAAGRDDDGRAGAVEHPGESLAESTRRAGHDHYPTVEAERGERIDGRGGHDRTLRSPVVEHLSADEARRLFLWAQGLVGSRKGGTPAEMLRRMGVVQLDTISVLARSHELVQYARLGAVERKAVEAAYWQRPPVAFEFIAHAFCVIPIEDWPWFGLRRRHPAKYRISLASARKRLTYRTVLDRLADGPASTTELGGAKSGGEWFEWSESKVAVEHLLRSGHVACIERRGWKRIYDLAERVIPAELLDARPTDHECRVELVRRAGRHLGVGTRCGPRRLLPDGEAELETAVAESGLVPVRVEGWPVASRRGPTRKRWRP